MKKLESILMNNVSCYCYSNFKASSIQLLKWESMNWYALATTTKAILFVYLRGHFKPSLMHYTFWSFATIPVNSAPPPTKWDQQGYKKAKAWLVGCNLPCNQLARLVVHCLQPSMLVSKCMLWKLFATMSCKFEVRFVGVMQGSLEGWLTPYHNKGCLRCQGH